MCAYKRSNQGLNFILKKHASKDPEDGTYKLDFDSDGFFAAIHEANRYGWAIMPDGWDPDELRSLADAAGVDTNLKLVREIMEEAKIPRDRVEVRCRSAGRF